MARLPRLRVEDWLLAMDEFHEGTPEQVAAEFKTRSFDRFFISATPRMNLFPNLTKTLRAPIAPIHTVTNVPLRTDLMGLFNEMRREHPDLADRALFIVPTLREANALFQNMQACGFPTRHRFEAPPATGRNRGSR
eukprot:UN04221